MYLMKRSMKRKTNLTASYCKFGICVKDIALCHLCCWHPIALQRLIDTILVRRYKMPFLPFSFTVSSRTRLPNRRSLCLREPRRSPQQPLHTAILRQGSQVKLTGQEAQQSQHRHSESLRWRREAYGAASFQQEKEDIPFKLATTNTMTTPPVKTNTSRAKYSLG